MQDRVRVDVPHSPALSPRQALNTALLLAAVLPRSGPQQLSATSSWPWSPFYLLSSLPAQEGGEEPGWSGYCAPATTACLEGTATRQALSRRCHVAPGCCCHSQSKAVPGAGLAAEGDRPCCREMDRAAQTPQARQGWGHCREQGLHRRVAGLSGDLDQRQPRTRSHRSPQCSLCYAAAKKMGPPSHTGVLELPALWGVTPKAGRFCCAHGSSQAQLGPTAAPQCLVPCLLWWCFLGKSHWIPPPSQTRGAHHSGSTRTSLQIFEQFIVPGICTKT